MCYWLLLLTVFVDFCCWVMQQYPDHPQHQRLDSHNHLNSCNTHTHTMTPSHTSTHSLTINTHNNRGPYRMVCPRNVPIHYRDLRHAPKSLFILSLSSLSILSISPCVRWLEVGKGDECCFCSTSAPILLLVNFPHPHFTCIIKYTNLTTNNKYPPFSTL